MKPYCGERQIKCRLIDELLAKYPKSIICIEVPFLSGKRWVDVLVITRNGDLVAYEVKSHLDTLRRMQEQVQDYLSTFNRVNLIVAPKHLYAVRKQLPERVGYASFEQQTNRFIYERRALRKERLSKQNLAHFIWKNGLRGGPSDRKKTVVELRARLVAQNTCKTIHKMAVAALRARYNARFQAFVNEKCHFTHIEDLEYLTREYDSLF